MLVLTRSNYQRIILSDGVVITVIEARNGRVHIGFEAPPEVVIVREELIFKGDKPDPREMRK